MTSATTAANQGAEREAKVFSKKNPAATPETNSGLHGDERGSTFTETSGGETARQANGFKEAVSPYH